MASYLGATIEGEMNPGVHLVGSVFRSGIGGGKVMWLGAGGMRLVTCVQVYR